MSSYNDSGIMSKKTMGLKEYKKLQKAKKCVKRTAAAQETKVKTTHSTFTAIVGASDALSTKAASADQDLSAATSEPKVTFDIIAHRKALEAALYEKMETPREMLIRCEYQLSLAAEYYTIKDGSADVVMGAKSVDDNGFETISRMVSSDNHDQLAIEEIQPLFQETTDVDKPVVCLPLAPEAAQNGSISLEQLFAAVAAEKTSTISPQKAMPSIASYNPHWADPAIVDYKIKQQAPRKASISTTSSSRSSFSVPTPDSSPVKTRRSYTSRKSHSSARSWSPPTPKIFPPALGHWAHYPEPKPYNAMDWSPPHMNWSMPHMNWSPPQWPMGQWR